MSLPANFLNGFASAAFQVEGAAKEGGRGLSIWDEFCATPGRIADGSNGDVACDSYHKWRQDIALLKEYGSPPKHYWSNLEAHEPIDFRWRGRELFLLEGKMILLTPKELHFT